MSLYPTSSTLHIIVLYGRSWLAHAGVCNHISYCLFYSLSVKCSSLSGWDVERSGLWLLIYSQYTSLRHNSPLRWLPSRLVLYGIIGALRSVSTGVTLRGVTMRELHSCKNPGDWGGKKGPSAPYEETSTIKDDHWGLYTDLTLGPKSFEIHIWDGGGGLCLYFHEINVFWGLEKNSQVLVGLGATLGFLGFLWVLVLHPKNILMG